MKVHKILDDKTIILEVGDGAFVSVHSHTKGECEIQFAGLDTGKVVLTSPPFDQEGFEASNLIFARYTPAERD